MDYKEKLDIIVKSCEDKRGTDIKILDLKGMTSVADYFVVVSGGSSNQVNAIADEIEDKMSEAGIELDNQEGKNSLRWILLDYGDIIVHVFHNEEREYYNLERLWSDEKVENKEDNN